MDVFSQPAGHAINFLGGQQKRDNNIKYRRLKYLLEVDLENGRKGIYNLLTSCGIVLNAEEQKHVEDFDDTIFVNYMIENYFFVPEDYDEKDAVDRYRKSSPIKKKEFLVVPTEFTILPTTDCNARCFYCFEKGKKITVMSMEIVNKVADYIIDCWNKTKQTITIRWFGGEPLYNMKAIDVISRRLTENGVDFKSSIISNGYLFTEEVAQKAVKDWKMNHAQITLDGTKDVYNQTKNYIYSDDENPFETIMCNMESMLKAGFTISIRMNVGTHNGDDLKQLVTYLSDRFKDDMNGKFSVYAHPLFETGMDDETKRTPEDRALVFQKLEELEEHMRSLGISLSIGRLGGLRTRHCMVDGGRAILILPDGKLGLCEHYTDSEYFGNLGDDRETWDWEEIKSLVEPTDMLPECNDCVLYPGCYRLKKCLDEIFCDKYVVDWTTRRTIENIKGQINKFYNGRNNGNCCGNNQKPRYDLYAGKIEFNNLINFVMLQEQKIKRINEKLGIDFSDLEEAYNEKMKNTPRQGAQNQ